MGTSDHRLAQGESENHGYQGWRPKENWKEPGALDRRYGKDRGKHEQINDEEGEREHRAQLRRTLEAAEERGPGDDRILSVHSVWRAGFPHSGHVRSTGKPVLL